MTSQLKFNPWVGEKYTTYKFGKLLLCGESHYMSEGENNPNFTINVIREILNKQSLGTPFYERIGKMFDENNPLSIWDNVAFANLIQNPMMSTRAQPSKEDIATINPAFEELISTLKPDKVIIFSKRLWNKWITERDAKILGEISNFSKKESLFGYSRDSGKFLAIGIKHPSWMFGNSFTEWSPLIKQFIQHR